MYVIYLFIPSVRPGTKQPTDRHRSTTQELGTTDLETNELYYIYSDNISGGVNIKLMK